MTIHDFNELTETIGDQGDLYELLFNLRKNDGIFIRITNKHIVSYLEKEIQKGIVIAQGDVYLFRISDDQNLNLPRKICSCCDQEIPNLLDKLVGIIQAYA